MKIVSMFVSLFVALNVCAAGTGKGLFAYNRADALHDTFRSRAFQRRR